MRSWTPRRPSPALEVRLFGASRTANPAREAQSRRLPGWGWLAPVACVFIVVLQLVAPEDGARLAGGNRATPVFATLSLSNRTLVTLAPGWTHSARNNVHGETFESTNWTTAPSSMRSLPVFLTLTNGLIQ